jgi:Ca2+:H+ antiporter
MNLSGSST